MQSQTKGDTTTAIQGLGLDPQAKEQARWIARKLGTVPLEVILCSDFTRTLETAKVLHEVHPQSKSSF